MDAADEFDAEWDIADNTLHALEQNAVSSTQKQPLAGVHGKSRITTYGSTGLSRNNHAAPKSAWKPPQPRSQQQQQRQPPPRPAPFRPQLPVHDAPPASAPEPPSSDYGFDDDEDIIDLDAPSTTVPAPADLPTRPRTVTPAPQSTRHASRAPLDPETEAAFAAADAELGAHVPAQWQSTPHLQPPAAENSAALEALQARVAALEAEQARLKASEKQARDAALAKQGEISIVRSNQDKAVKEYERRIAAMQKLHTDETTKWKSELEAGRQERERMTTDNRFLQHDLAQEVEQGKRLTGPARARPAVNGMGTPRRSKKATQGWGDGFDDDEVRMVSPSRSRDKDKPKDQTPRVGTKRKRPANDSPVPALSFSHAPAAINGQQSVSRENSMQSPPAIAAPASDGRFEFMQKLLAHAFEGHVDREPSLEALSRLHYPSDARHSLSALLMDGISPVRARGDSDPLPVGSAKALLGLWNRALMEKYYKPIGLLLDLLRFCLAFEPASVSSQLVEEAAPLCTHCIEKVVQIMHRVSTSPSWLSTTEGQEHAAVLEDIDVDDMLDFLLDLAGAASLSNERIDALWQCIEHSALLSMLNMSLSIAQLTTGLRILATSVRDASFGPIRSDADSAQQQVRSEKEIIDRLTILLFNVPTAPKDEAAYTVPEILALRVEVLNVLKPLCATENGSNLLASHRSFIGRLVRFLDRQVNALYDSPPSFGIERLTLSSAVVDSASDSDNALNPHDLTIRAITLATTTLHHLLVRNAESATFNFLAKLQVVKGGYHKFLAAFTRLAFSEQLVFEKGLGEEVVEAAHTVLDNVLSPEEGEAILAAVETPRGTKGSTYTGATTERDDSEGAGAGEDGEGMEEEPG